MEPFILAGVALLIVVFIISFFRRSPVESAVQDMRDRVSTLQGQLQSLQNEMQNTSTRFTSDGTEIRRTIHEEMVNIRSVLDMSRNSLDTQLSNLMQSYANLTQHLGRIDETTGKVEELSLNILGLQQILSNARSRGSLGEIMLEKELADVLPANSYSMQYELAPDKRVDAVLRFPQGMVAIDAKFPLESYRLWMENNEVDEKKKLYKKFLDAVQTKIIETAKYIVPSAGTLNFAIMYIPAESVYYEAFVNHSEILDFAVAHHRVYPAGPTTLFIYLNTIAIGLRGLQIEKDAAQILSDLQTLGKKLDGVTPSMDTAIKQLEHTLINMQKVRNMLTETRRLVNAFGSESSTEDNGVDDQS